MKLALIIPTSSLALAFVLPPGPSQDQPVSVTQVGELIPVLVTLTDQVPRVLISGIGSSGLPKAERRAQIVELLRAKAGSTQGPLLEWLEARVEQGLAEDVRGLWIQNIVTGRMTQSVIEEVRTHADVAAVDIDPGISPAAVPFPTAPVPFVPIAPVPLASPGSPSPELQQIVVPQVWDTHGVTGRGVIVAVLDFEYCSSHLDLIDQKWVNPGEVPGDGVDNDMNGYIDDIYGWNFQDGDNDLEDPPPHGSGHGLKVAGCVVGDGTQGMALGPAPGARFIFGRLGPLAATGLEALQYALAQQAQVVNCSWGIRSPNQSDRTTWRGITTTLKATGIILVVAAGNEGPAAGCTSVSLRTPGDCPDVITVGGVTPSDMNWNKSSRGPASWNFPPFNDYPCGPDELVKPDIVAPSTGSPGANLLNYCTGYSFGNGTSIATPLVTGVVAQLLEIDPTLDEPRTKILLGLTALDLGDPGKDNIYGSGRIDAFLAAGTLLPSSSYCMAKMNSCGTLPMISARGEPRASSSSGYTIEACNVPGQKMGWLIYTNLGGGNMPWNGGSLCIDPSYLVTVPVTDTVGTLGLCDGVLSIDMNAFAAGVLGGSPAPFLSQPGTTVHCQFVGRDPGDPFNTMLTAAWIYTVAP